MIEYNKNFDDNSILPFFIQPQSDAKTILPKTRGQVQFCHNLNINLFEKGNIPCKQEFREYEKNDKFMTTSSKVYAKITSFYGYSQSKSAQQIQTDDRDIEFLKVF